MRRVISFLTISLLIVGTAFAQTTYNGKGGGASDLAVSLLADSDNFSGDPIVVSNYIFDRLSFHSGSGFSWISPWLENGLTVRLDDYKQTLNGSNIKVYFHPTKSDTEGMKFVVGMKGKYYKIPSKIGFKAKAYNFKDMSILFILITELTIEDKVYKGEIPESFKE